MGLNSLSTELLLSILEYLCSPADLVSSICASARFYRVFVTYKHQVLKHILRRAILPACRADAIAALDAQEITRLLKNGAGVETVKSKCFAILKSYRTQRCQNLDDLNLDNSRLDALFRFYASIERLVIDFCNWSLDNLDSSAPKPSNAEVTIHPSLHLSPTELGRLQRAFFRMDIYARFFRFLHQLDAQSAMLNASQIVLSFISQFKNWEFEEIISVLQFLTHLVEEAFDRIEDDIVDYCRLASIHRNPETCSSQDQRKSIQPANENDGHTNRDASGDEASELSNTLKKSGLSFFTTSHRNEYHDTHIMFTVSYGLPYVHQMSRLDIPALKRAILESCVESCSKGRLKLPPKKGHDLRHCAAHLKDVVLKGKLASINGDSLDSPNLGWEWGTNFTNSIKSSTPANFNLRNQGYVFWDQERLESSGLVSCPHLVHVGAEYFPPDYHERSEVPGVEERVADLKLDSEVFKNWKEDV